MKIVKYICLFIYYGFARYLPVSYVPIAGRPSKWIRYQLCRRIFAKCGKNVNVERLARFGSGKGIIIGDNSGLCVNCNIPSTIHIGSNVMMGPNCTILYSNHCFADIHIPMMNQGTTPPHKITTIEDDVWIGTNVIMTPCRTIAKGSIIAAGCVLCKDFPEYSIVGGNPATLIKSRL